jgi:LemA protein
MNLSKNAPLWIALGLLLLCVFWGISTNNALITLDENVQEHWSQVENVYQRRADLIPNLVNTVKGYAKHEADVLETVTQARAQVGQVKIQNPGDIDKFAQAQGQLTSALSRLMVVVEKYPDLKADRNFRDLQAELEGTENRIAVERRNFNESAKEYNIYLKRFPQSMIASFRNFQPRKYFEADAGAKTAPKVEF